MRRVSVRCLASRSSYGSLVEGAGREPRVATSPGGDAMAGNGATGAAAAAAAAAAVAAATAAARLSSNANGVGRAVVPSEAETSSDSGGDDDDEDDERGDDEHGGSPSARDGGDERGARDSTPSGVQGGRHNPVRSTVSAETNAGNGHGSPKQEVDEHAARASDAASAALAAAIASATGAVPHLAQPSRAGNRKSSPSLSPARSPQTVKAFCSRTPPPPGSTTCGPILMVFPTEVLPSGWESPGPVGRQQVDVALESAGYIRPLSPSPVTSRCLHGGASGASTGTRGDVGGAKAVKMDTEDAQGADGAAEGGAEGGVDLAQPSVLPAPTASIPCMVGQFRVDEATGVHRCTGTWAMSRADLEAASRVETRASPFEVKVSPPPGASSLPFPHSGRYEGHFLVRQPPKPVTKVDEDDLEIAFTRNCAGGWNVEGQGRNIYGQFTITGRLGADRRLELYRTYPKPKSRPAGRGGHRRSSSGTTASGAGGAKGVSSPGARGPSRGKHPRAAPPAAPSLPAAKSLPQPQASNGSSGAHGDHANLETPAPAAGSRRVSRTPSYLIKDIGGEGTTHLSHGLRKCLTVLKGLMSVRGKSEWFLEPVDHVRLMLWDYPRIIKRPMDLGTVRKKLEGGHYQVRLGGCSKHTLLWFREAQSLDPPQ